MHILEIPSFFTPYGGEFCLEQAKALKRQGHEVRILSNVQLAATVGLKDYLTLPYGRRVKAREGITVWQTFQRGVPKMVRWNVDRWVNVDGEGENVGTELHFVNHQQSLKILKRDMKRTLLSANPVDRLQIVKDQIETTHSQLHPKK